MPYSESMIPSPLGQSPAAGNRGRSESKPRKSVLFCRSCGHESPVDGDWRVARVDRRTRNERAVYTCPECAHTVSVRPDGGRDGTRGSNRTPLSNAP